MRTQVASLVLFLSLLLAGCVPPNFVAHQNLTQQLSRMQSLAILPPRVDSYEIGAGGVLEKIDEWSEKSTQNVVAVIERTLGSKPNIRVSSLRLDSLPDEVRAELEQTQLLFDAVNDSILLHMYGPPPQRFEEKWDRFDYSLGKETEKLNISGFDTLLIVKGIDHISSAGRKAVQATTMLAAAALGVIIIPQGGTTAMSAALVDARTGELLWYVFERSQGTHDLRDPSSTEALIVRMLSNFPVR